MIKKETILILGKLTPPIIGPAIATEIILNSKLKDEFDLLHLDTRINKDLSTMGRWSFLKLFKSLTIYIDFIKIVKVGNPDLILVPISQTTMGFLKDALFIWLGKLLKKKIVIQLRGSNFKNWLNSSNQLTNKFVEITLKKCVGVIVLGKNLQYLFDDYFRNEDIHVVSNGANYRLLTKKKGTLTILYFANFLSSKSFDDVLKAVVILKQKGISNFNLKAVGAWDNLFFKEQCLAIIKKNELTNVALFPPQSGDDKMQFFADADIFVFCPKMPEGHPWVIVEALANSLPIIATDRGAIIDSVLDQKNGYIVDIESPDQIAEKLELLLSNQKLRTDMSEFSLSHYQKHFTENKMVTNLSEVFRKIIR